MPAVRCEAVARSTGEQCKRWSMLGATKCPKHLGWAFTARSVENRQKIIDHARMRLIANADEAVDALLELIKDGPPGVKLKAAESLLDRIGIRGGTEVALSAGGDESDAARIISERLERIRSRIITGETVLDDTTAGLDASKLPESVETALDTISEAYKPV